jgi:hypothetical protein
MSRQRGSSHPLLCARLSPLCAGVYRVLRIIPSITLTVSRRALELSESLKSYSASDYCESITVSQERVNVDLDDLLRVRGRNWNEEFQMIREMKTDDPVVCSDVLLLCR